MTQPAAYLQTKRHYEVLDGLRGVAALIVVIFHTFEIWSHGDHTRQILNHGYLAVDFFFLLSGFVVAYAYDDRWNRMTQWEFFKRRLIRLQPMVIAGSVLGAILFYFQTGPAFPLIAQTPVWKMLLVMLLGFTLLPLPYQFDIRGWYEMHPLDGPAWSLYFEYIANILYALVFRRISKAVLAILVFLSAVLLVHFALTNPNGDVIGGWSTSLEQQHVGFARLLYPFLAGMLLMRSGRRIQIGASFPVCSLLLALVLCFPRIGGPVWHNGLYDALIILFAFPLIVAMGAGEWAPGPRQERLCKFFGEISYPLYITHYPLIYVYTAWVLRDHPTPQQGILWGIVLFFAAITIAYTCLKLYDEPVRAWLAKKFLPKQRA